MLSLHDSQAWDKHWTQKECFIRETLKESMPKFVTYLIVSRERIIFFSIRLKLTLMKQFVKALSTDSECFQYLTSILPAFSWKTSKRAYLMDLICLNVMENLPERWMARKRWCGNMNVKLHFLVSYVTITISPRTLQ